MNIYQTLAILNTFNGIEKINFLWNTDFSRYDFLNWEVSILGLDYVKENHYLAESTIRQYCSRADSTSKHKINLRSGIYSTSFYQYNLKERLSDYLSWKKMEEVKNDDYDAFKEVRNKYYAYLMFIDEGIDGYIKVGYSHDPQTRKHQLGTSYSIQKVWKFYTKEDAYEMEIWLHRYFRTLGEIQGQDHFINVNINKINYDLLDRIADSIPERAKEFGLA